MEEIVAWPEADRKQRLEILRGVTARRRRGFRTVSSKRKIPQDS
jgi:predicted Fe-S protein YdhL (DUF1289 family)